MWVVSAHDDCGNPGRFQRCKRVGGFAAHRESPNNGALNALCVEHGGEVGHESLVLVERRVVGLVAESVSEPVDRHNFELTGEIVDVSGIPPIVRAL